MPEGGAVADIGTDHGYLAAALIEEGRAEHVIASDLNLGPCEAARRTVRDEIINLHNGTFTIENADGGGTEVTIRLPERE